MTQRRTEEAERRKIRRGPHLGEVVRQLGRREYRQVWKEGEEGATVLGGK